MVHGLDVSSGTAEETVYITVDKDGGTRGKAAIDVVGSQVGGVVGDLL
jgi:ATP/ADP translocase